jgi:hypothetical protein
VTDGSSPETYRQKLRFEEGSGLTTESNRNQDRVKGTEVRVKLSLCLTKDHVMKTYPVLN